jgi:phospholipase C
MSPSRRAVLAATLAVSVTPYGLMAQAQTPQTPIEHVIVIVGENHTFDNLFGGYIPRPGQTIMNLLSQDIIDDNGNPGLQFCARPTEDGQFQGRLQPQPDADRAL